MSRVLKDFTKTPNVRLQNYDTKTKGQIEVVPNVFEATFNNWKGGKEQVDDVTVFCLEI